MSSALRFAVYRDRSPLAPTYLGDVLANDREAAVRAGESQFGKPVVAHRTSDVPRLAPPPQLERAVAALERRRSRGHFNRPPRGQGEQL
jgi:hypothetical protein